MQLANAADLIELTGEIVTAHVSNNTVSIGDVASLIQKVHTALTAVGGQADPEPQQRSRAVSIKASVKPDYVVCLECGSRQTMLKRHLQTAHRFSPSEYRAAFGLSDTHPLVAPKYAEKRRALAIDIGLGQKGRITNRRAKAPKR